MLLALLLAAQVSALDLSFDEAKAAADRYEDVLAPRDVTALVDAQRQALETAMATCGPARREYSAFVVVVHVAADGTTDRTWRNNEAPYAVCMDRELSVARLPVATGKPFHASYELSFAE
jgi:hypothetical protein